MRRPKIPPHPEIPYPGHPGVIELPALGAILRACPHVTEEEGHAAMERRAGSLGFEVHGSGGLLLGLALMCTLGDLPNDVPRLAALARVRAHRVH